MDFELQFRLAKADDLVDIAKMLSDDALNGGIVGTFQLTFIQYLTHQGGIRAQVEAVRIYSKNRGKEIGAKVFSYIIEKAKNKGFMATHKGMKLKL